MTELSDGAPWVRVRQPVPVPDVVTPAGLLTMPLGEFSELLRGNLLPRSDSREDRQGWKVLWSTIARDPRAASRAQVVLAGFLDVTAAAVAAGGLDPAQEKRARGFRRQVQEAWARVERDEGRHQPLAWAGPASEFDAAGRSVIALLVSAIAGHRSRVRREGEALDADRRLWSALGSVGLDPASPSTAARSVDEHERALVWAGNVTKGWSGSARAVAGLLVAAIATHRQVHEGEASWEDRRLWHILTVVDLDPRDYA